MTIDGRTLRPEAAGYVTFIDETNRYVSALGELANQLVLQDKPGAAAVVQHLAEHVAGMGMDTVLRWPV